MKYVKSTVYTLLLVVVGAVLAATQGGPYFVNMDWLLPSNPIEALMSNWVLLVPLIYILFFVLSNFYGEGYQEIDLT